MVLPSKIRVAGFDISIISWSSREAANERVHGRFNSLSMKMYICVECNPDVVFDTFLHEINHAIYWAYGIVDEDNEERTVALLATAWVQVYRDNPQIVTWIIKQVAKIT